MLLKVKTEIKLDKWSPRDYQIPFCDAFENKGYKKLLITWPRRSGKDICCFNLLIRAALRDVGVYYYVFPTYNQARKAVWTSITNDGTSFLDFIPKELIEGTNSSDMSIRLTNGSLIQLLGSEKVDRLVGTNARGIIFSEFALQRKRALLLLRPILVANDGWMIIQSTPRSKNHFYDLFEIALSSPSWFCQKLTLDDTKHIPLALIEKEKEEGYTNDELIRQEYYCDFLTADGTFYLKYIQNMRLTAQIGVIPWEIDYPVSTSWDIGIHDLTSVCFFQQIDRRVHIIDYYENNDEGIEHYVNLLKSKPYTYDKHWGPFDIKVRDYGTGVTRLEKARRLGLQWEVRSNKQGERVSALPSVSIQDGIEHVKSSFSRMWIDEVKCSTLIRALENYHKERDEMREIWLPVPAKTKWNHAADSFRYLCLSLSRNRSGLTPEDIDKSYNEARYGTQSNLPRIFQDQPNRY